MLFTQMDHRFRRQNGITRNLRAYRPKELKLSGAVGVFLLRRCMGVKRIDKRIGNSYNKNIMKNTVLLFLRREMRCS